MNNNGSDKYSQCAVEELNLDSLMTAPSTTSRSSDSFSITKYPASRLGYIPRLVKKSYSLWFMLISSCVLPSRRKNKKPFSSNFTTGILSLPTLCLMTASALASFANLRYIGFMKKLLILLIASASIAIADELTIDGHGGYLSVDEKDGLEQQSVFIHDTNRTYIGQMDEDGDFIALGGHGSAFGSRINKNCFIVLRTKPADDTE